MSTAITRVRRGALHGRSEIVMPILLLITAGILTFGALSWEISSTARPGPQFVPLLVAGALAIIAVAYLIDIWRKPQAIQPTEAEAATEFSVDMLHDLGQMDEPTASAETKERFHSDWATLLPVIAAFLAFALLLPYLGWIISAALLFWVVAHFLGSTRPLFDVWVALIVASSVQLIFGGLLGLNLPAGFIGGL